MPTTPNLQMQRPLNGTFVGTWDVPVNGNWDILDNAIGASTSIALTNVPVVLSAVQAQCSTIVFTGALTGNCTITFPAAQGKLYNIVNLTTNDETFSVSLTSGGQVVCPPAGQATAVYTDGTNFRFVGLGLVGSYVDFAGTAVPRWISQCTVPPFLNCDGSAFNPITYPALNAYLGGATLPDLRGRFRASVNQGTGRLTAINGDVLFSAGGSNTIAQANLPNYDLPITDPSHSHTYTRPDSPLLAYFAGAGVQAVASVGAVGTNTEVTGITVNSGGSGTAFVSPSIVAGITLIRAG